MLLVHIKLDFLSLVAIKKLFILSPIKAKYGLKLDRVYVGTGLNWKICECYGD